jgi:hypothetical protein
MGESDASWIDGEADGFERAWMTDQSRRIEDHLTGVAEPLRSRLLEELLRIERQIRMKRGEVPDPEDYRRRFPGDLPIIETVFDGERAGTSTTGSQRPGAQDPADDLRHQKTPPLRLYDLQKTPENKELHPVNAYEAEVRCCAG